MLKCCNGGALNLLGNGRVWAYLFSMQHVTLTAVLTPESDGYVSLCPELDIASQGQTVEEALANLKEALEGFYEAASPEEIASRLTKPSLVTHIDVAYA